jgi:hypothetical protein
MILCLIWLVRLFCGFIGQHPEPDGKSRKTHTQLEPEDTEEMLTEVIRFGIHRQSAEQDERLMLLNLLRMVRRYYKATQAQRSASVVEQSDVPVVKEAVEEKRDEGGDLNHIIH